MCGIAGFLQLNGDQPDRSQLETMVATIASRGPDGAGHHVEGPLALGHRRLFIIDLEGGAQPMFNENGRIAVTYNGEIYNFQELREELKSKGHIFKTRSDSEVIVHAWEEWGKHCVEKFRGMFAFAIADWNTQRVFLARDQLGIKPLVYTKTKDRFAFASELQALKVLPEFNRELSTAALDQYLLLSYIPAPATVYSNSCKLPPAHRMIVHFDGRVEAPERYYDVQFELEQGVSEEEWVERLDGAMRESVKAHLVSDVPFGCFLSGGMDSTAVAGLMSEEMNTPVKAFSIGFSEKEADEMQYARQAAERFGLEHIIQTVEPHAMDILPDLVRHYGEPFGDQSALPTYYVCRMAREQVPMVLSGDGGDEGLAGYDSYFHYMRCTLDPALNRPPWKKVLRPLLSQAFPARFPPDPKASSSNLDKFLAQVNFTWADLRRALWRPEYTSVVSQDVPPLTEAWRAGKGRLNSVNMPQFSDYRIYLPNNILAKVDIASMMHGLEVRTPFIDRVFLETALRIPPEITFSFDPAGSFEGKRPLRGWLRRYFPESFIDRPKQGFTLPLAQWFDKEGGAMARHVEERFLDSGSPLHNYFRPETLAKIHHDHNRVRNHGHIIWLLLFLNEWLVEG